MSYEADDNGGKEQTEVTEGNTADNPTAVVQHTRLAAGWTGTRHTTPGTRHPAHGYSHQLPPGV